MRKLLLGTTAIAAAATLTANAALADVSISGAYEFFYQSRSSNITANDGTSTDTDSEIKITFSNQTDSGLTVGFVSELGTDEGDTPDEGSLSISGGFGKLVLGENDGVGDNYGIAATDLIAEEAQATGVDSLTLTKADIAGLGADNPKIAYHLPAMGGLTAGLSHTNSGPAGASDTTQYGAQYAMSAGGAAITLGGATGTTEVSNATDIDSQNMGVKIVSGATSVIISQAKYEAANTDETATGAAISFKVSDAMTLGAHTTEVDDDTSNEEYTNSGAEIQYTIASGLTAVVGVEDYDYKIGTGAGAGTTADSGTVSRLTIKAAF